MRRMSLRGGALRGPEEGRIARASSRLAPACRSRRDQAVVVVDRRGQVQQALQDDVDFVARRGQRPRVTCVIPCAASSTTTDRW